MGGCRVLPTFKYNCLISGPIPWIMVPITVTDHLLGTRRQFGEFPTRTEIRKWRSSWLKELEPPHNKTNKMTMCLVKTLISLGIFSVWSVFAVHWMGRTQAFFMPRLIWVFAGGTCHFVGFVMRWLIFSVCEMHINQKKKIRRSMTKPTKFPVRLTKLHDAKLVTEFSIHTSQAI